MKTTTKMVFVVVRRPVGPDSAWQLGRIFTNMEAAEEYQDNVQLGAQWESTIQIHQVWNAGFLTS